jgi:hypothetical protein
VPTLNKSLSFSLPSAEGENLGPGYEFGPCPDVPGGNVICWASVPAGNAGEGRLIGSVLRVDRSTLRAGSAGVAGVDIEHRNSGQLRLIGDEVAQLAKCPVVKSCALWATGLNARADTLEIFKGDRPARALRLRHDRFGYAVIGVCLEPPLFSGKLSQSALRSLCAASLKSRLALGETASCGLDGGAGVAIPVAVERQIDNAKVNAENALKVDLRGVRDVAHAGDVPFAAHQHQVDFAFPEGEKSALPFSASVDNLLATAEQPNAHGIPADKANYPLVVGLRCVLSERTNGADPPSLVGVRHLGDAPDHHLRGKTKPGAGFSVGELVKVELADFPGRETALRKMVASLIAALKRCAQEFFLVTRRSELNVRDKFHFFKYRIFCDARQRMRFRDAGFMGHRMTNLAHRAYRGIR